MMNKSLYDRMKEERKRLGMTQTELAMIASVKRETWSRYEKGKIQPGTNAWVALATAGADVNYILTGKILLDGTVVYSKSKQSQALLTAEDNGDFVHSASLTEKEQSLLENYRVLTQEEKNTVENILLALANKADHSN